MFRSCPWEVHKFADYRTFQSSGSSDQTAIHLLLHVNATGQAVEGFRCTVEGPVITTDFRGTDIFTLELLLDYQFKYDIDAHNVDIKTNCFTSKWQDFEDLLARGFIYQSGVNYCQDDLQLRKFLQGSEACPVRKRSGSSPEDSTRSP